MAQIHTVSSSWTTAQFTMSMNVIEDTGAMLHFLPPYSPDLNPIELAFSKVKSGIRDLESSDLDIDTTILTAFTSITEHDCKQWISHSLYCGHKLT